MRKAAKEQLKRYDQNFLTSCTVGELEFWKDEPPAEPRNLCIHASRSDSCAFLLPSCSYQKMDKMTMHVRLFC